MRPDREARDESSQLTQIAETQARLDGRPPSRQDVRHQQAASPLEGSTGVSEAALPDAVGQYQDAHDRHDVDAALATFAPTGTVKDDGHEYHGPDEIRDWLARASTEFTYTRTLTG